MTRERPFGVLFLTVLASMAALMAIIHTLQLLHLFPIWAGPLRFFTFDLVGAILWGLLAAVYVWLVKMLWEVNSQAWLFLVMLSGLNLMMTVISLIGASTFLAVLPSILVNGLILIYCLLPNTREVFGTD